MINDMRFTYDHVEICIIPERMPCHRCKKKRVLYAVDPWFVLAFQWMCIDHIHEQLKLSGIAKFDRDEFLKLADATIECDTP